MTETPNGSVSSQEGTTVKTVRKRIGIAAVIAGSTFIVAPLVAGAANSHPTRVCLDNAAANCGVVHNSLSPAGGSGSRVAVRPEIPGGRPDAKDSPNFGPVGVEVLGRPDAKDNPNFGPVNAGRPDAKDNPNFGPVSAEVASRPDAKDNPNFGSVTVHGSVSVYVPSIITEGAADAEAAANAKALASIYVPSIITEGAETALPGLNTGLYVPYIVTGGNDDADGPASAGRGDAKDHPNFGSIAPSAV
jgi:hypothetical protein